MKLGKEFGSEWPAGLRHGTKTTLGMSQLNGDGIRGKGVGPFSAKGGICIQGFAPMGGFSKKGKRIR